MEEERIPTPEEKAAPKKETVLPAARAEHVCVLAKAIGENAPTAQTLRSFKESCEQTRAALNEAAEAGEKGVQEAKEAMDIALIDLSRSTLEKQTGHVQEYESLSAALRAQADRQAALEILEVSVPLIEKEEKQDEVLTEAMAYCKLQQTEELTYTAEGVKTKLPVYKTTADAAERVRTAFVHIYNHQPSRQHFCEALEDDCKAQAEKEKIEKAARNAARGAYRHERKLYFAEHADKRKKRNTDILHGLLFLAPAVALLVLALIFGWFKKDWRIVVAFVLLLALGLFGGYLWLRKRLGALMQAARAESPALRAAAEALEAAKRRVKEQNAAVREALHHYAEFRKTYLK